MSLGVRAAERNSAAGGRVPREERNRWGPSAVTRRLHGPSAARGHPRRAPSTQFLAPAMIPDRRSTMDPVKAGANGHGDPQPSDAFKSSATVFVSELGQPGR